MVYGGCFWLDITACPSSPNGWLPSPRGESAAGMTTTDGFLLGPGTASGNNSGIYYPGWQGTHSTAWLTQRMSLKPLRFWRGTEEERKWVTCPVNGIMKATLQRLAPLCIQREQTPVAFISIFMETLYSKWQSRPASFDTCCNNKYLCCISLH